MFEFTFLLTVVLLLLGPLKIIAAFAQLTRRADQAYRRRTAAYATLLASIACALIILLARTMAESHHLSVDALQITGGLILLAWSLNAIFQRADATPPAGANPTPIQLAMSPLTTPVIIKPAGVAALMMFVLLGPDAPGWHPSIAGALALVMVLNFLVMFFNERIVSRPWLLGAMQLLGSVLVVVQVASAVKVLLNASRTLGVIGR
jgi:multiple antibiotic resistance protein